MLAALAAPLYKANYFSRTFYSMVLIALVSAGEPNERQCSVMGRQGNAGNGEERYMLRASYCMYAAMF